LTRRKTHKIHPKKPISNATKIIFGLNLKLRRERLTLEDFITIMPEKMIVGAEEGDPAREGDPKRVAVGLASYGSRPDPRPTAPWVTAKPTASSAVGLLSFSRTISLSLLNDKKKKKKKNGRGCRQKGRNGEEE
jgi:hypothetical protein